MIVSTWNLELVSRFIHSILTVQFILDRVTSILFQNAFESVLRAFQHTDLDQLDLHNMVGDSLKRPHPARSPDPNPSGRKIARIDGASNYQSMSNGDRLSSSRRSSFSQPRQPFDIEAIPKVLESFILAVFKHSQSSRHLHNVETDYESMLPRHNEFPAFGTQRTTRLNQARNDVKTTEAQTAEATTSLLNAFKAHFQSGPTSHQDCVSQSEEIRQQNQDLKKALKRAEDRLDREIRANKRLEDRMADLEDISRGISKTLDSTCEKYKFLEESTTKDRLSFRNRCSALEAEMDKSKTKHKAFDDYIYSSTATNEEQAQSFNCFKQDVELLHRKLDTDVDSKFKEHSETLIATQKNLQEFKDQAIRPPVSPDTVLDPLLENIERRLKAAETLVNRLKEDAEGENSMVITMVDDLQSSSEQLQVKMTELQTMNEEKIQNLGLSMGTLTTDVARIEELNWSIKNELQTAIDEIKREPKDLNSQLDYISKTVETHIDLIQRHEVRLNSVTTDEMYRQMESQFRHAYGVPNELRGIIQRQSKVEAMSKSYHEAVNNMHTRVEAMATELRGSKYIGC